MKTSFLKVKESPLFARILPIVILIFISVLFTVLTKGKFGEIRNLKLILNQAIITATIATGAVFIFGTGNVNIAMGATTSLVATIAVLSYNSTESIIVMFATSIVVSVLIMLLMALLSIVLGVSVMFVSIVMMILLASIQQAILGASNISIPYVVSNGLVKANFTYIAFVLFFIVAFALFHYTKIGRGIKFIGSNKFCAAQSGIYLGKHLFWAFSVTGVAIGLASIMLIIRSGSISVNTAGSLNMDVVLAIVLGGMSIFGGSRSYVYAGILGAITVTLLNNGLLMIGISPMVLQLVRGVFFLTLIFIGQKRPDRLPSNEI